MTFVLVLLLCVFMDRAVAQSSRMYSAGTVPWGDKKSVSEFYKHYGWVKFPRTALLLAIPAVTQGLDLFPAWEIWLLVAFVFFVAAYAIAAIVDVFSAGKAVRRKEDLDSR